MPPTDFPTLLRGLCDQLSQATGSTDTLLLQRWVTLRDESAFELILHRHGRLVLGTCQRVLRCPQDVQDAFQATFLLLVRRASTIRQGSSLPGWLYRTAYRVALRAQRTRSRQPQQTLSEMTEPVARDQPPMEHNDLLTVLDREINHLPEKFRVPFILCHLQGKTNEQAAQELACPVGTILSRLHTARQRLRARLARRGVELTPASLPLVFSSVPEKEGPSTLVETTLQLTTRPLTSEILLSQPVLLAKGVLQTMMLTRLTLLASLTLLLVTGAIGVGMTLLQASPTPNSSPLAPAPESKNEPPVVAQNDREIVIVAPCVGSVSQIKFKVGEVVKKDDVLIHLDDLCRKKLTVESARNKLLELMVKEREAKVAVAKRLASALKDSNIRVPGSVSVEEMKAAELDLGACTASLETIREEFAQSKSLMLQLVFPNWESLPEVRDLRAPQLGVITEVLCVKGFLTNEGTPLLKMRPLSTTPPPKVEQTDLQVPTEQGGVIVNIHVKVGDTVKANQLLGKIKDDLALSNLRIKEAQREAAQFGLQICENMVSSAKLRLDRMQEKHQKGLVSEDEVQSTKLTLDRYLSELSEKKQACIIAEAEIRQARAIVEQHQIRSPVDGVVTKILHRRGEAVKQFETVFLIKEKE